MFKCFQKKKFKPNEVAPPTDVKEAFLNYAHGGDSMSAGQLQRFLVDHQAEVDCSLSDSEQIIEKMLQMQSERPQQETATSPTTDNDVSRLSLQDFFQFLFLDDLNGPIKSQVHNDMSAPLSHYFIYTGHNSYLTGNQLSSDCSNAPIIKALQRGVRVIELDLWPNSAKNDINVVHGRTLTTPVQLIKCLIAIKEYAFVKSQYPVIITLEDHLTPDLQAKVAEMISQTFGEMLYYPEEDGLAEFPSPESLMNRIVISTKPPKEYLQSNSSKDKVNNVLMIGRESSEDEASGKESQELMDDQVSGKESQELMDEADAAERQSESDQDEEEMKPSSQMGAPEYKRLITIHAGKPKGGLKDSLNICGDFVKRLSLSEQELERAASSHGTDLVRFTQKNIIRVYPKGTRFNSSNFKPLVGWMYGSQMVAFNMQGYGKSLWLMHGMFRANGGCGYLKKPDFLMTRGPNDELFDPKITLPVKKTLKVKVYMGDGWSSDFSPTHFDTFSPPDFYTKVYIVGVPADCAKKKTKVDDDKWVPIWNEEFEFPLTVPELALLRIEVREHDRSEKDDFGGQTCLPISELTPGFRSIPLYDKRGDKYNSVKLFMRFQFQELTS